MRVKKGAKFGLLTAIGAEVVLVAEICGRGGGGIEDVERRLGDAAAGEGMEGEGGSLPDGGGVGIEGEADMTCCFVMEKQGVQEGRR